MIPVASRIGGFAYAIRNIVVEARKVEASGRKVKASKDDPQYEVKSEKSGGTAVHKPSALDKD